MSRSFYDMAEYYDIAFSRDVSQEVNFLIQCFEKHAEISVRRILEPACGSGIYLSAFAKKGFEILGYDYNPEMVAYAKKQVSQEEHSALISVMQGDMRTLAFDQPFDAALNLINSLGHCFSDEALNAHLNVMSRSLKKGGIYVVEFTCAYDSVEQEREKDKNHSWVDEKDSIKITTTWHPREYDFQKKLRKVVSKIKVENHQNGEAFHFEEEQCLRLWYFEDFKNACEKAGFQIVAVYDQKENLVTLPRVITGDQGPLYYVLKR